MARQHKIIVTQHLDRIEITLHVKSMSEQKIMEYIDKLGYKHTTAEKENIALFSCDEIIVSRGMMYYHKDYMIRSLADTLKLYLHSPVVLPVIEFEEEEK